MDSPAEEECIVRGTLAFALRLSQIAGLAPISLKKKLEGWSVRLSPTAVNYSRLFIAIFGLLAILTFVVDLSLNTEYNYLIHIELTRILYTLDVGTVMLVVLFASFSGLSRMRNVIDCLLQLQKINLKLNPNHRQTFNERKRKVIIISLLSTISFNSVSDYGIYMLNVIRRETDLKKVTSSCMCVLFAILLIALEVVFIEFSEIVFAVLRSLQNLNNSLQSLLQEMNCCNLETKKYKDAKLNSCHPKFQKSMNSIIDTIAVVQGSTNTCPESISTKLRRLSLIYCSICDVDVNSSYSILLVIILLSVLTHLVIAPYHAVIHLLKANGCFAIIQIIGALLHFCSLLLIIEPCHRTIEQMTLTKHIIGQMSRICLFEYNIPLYELEMFYRYLILNDVTYTAAQMVTLDRKLVVRILGSITTYLVVALQLRFA